MLGEQTPPKQPPKQPPTNDSKPKPDKPQRKPARGDLGSIETKLNEMFGAIAVGQAGLAIASGDARHFAGAEVTNAMGPALTAAWVDLARENDAVKRVLLRLGEGTAWGGVIATSLGFVYSQAQAYNAVPRDLPNPWVNLTPESPEVNEPVSPSPATPANAGGVGNRTTAKDDESPTATDTAVSRAEAERRAVEERRKQRGS